MFSLTSTEKKEKIKTQNIEEMLQPFMQNLFSLIVFFFSVPGPWEKGPRGAQGSRH